MSRAAARKYGPAWNKGLTGIYSKETLQKIRTAKLGIKLSNQHKKNISKGLQGKNTGPKTENHKKNISKGLKNYYKLKKLGEEI